MALVLVPDRFVRGGFGADAGEDAGEDGVCGRVAVGGDVGDVGVAAAGKGDVEGFAGHAGLHDGVSGVEPPGGRCVRRGLTRRVRGVDVASIHKRSNGKWRARYRDPDGREHARHFDRKVDAQRWLDKVTVDLLTGRYVDPNAGRTALGAFAVRWLAARPSTR